MEEFLGKFDYYLSEAQKRVLEKYPSAKFYSGQYSPDITNFHFQYTFATLSLGIQVSVNTAPPDHVNFILIKTRQPKGLRPIDLPIYLSLADAYSLATNKGLKPNLYGAVVFLQDELNNATPGPAYWFLDQNDDQKWIEVGVNPPHEVKVTTQHP